ncbi:leucine-rich PPR motif-containing protein, mitochondrial-like [Galendromus occidentalis]|uniref:Leucine-rich PPR motif-containing protein, mitochondrial-like n=1 Tax=Galendromus occidentalis TaxID=34638 RepID=A0AAJ7P9U3_9ACAR|nr:leucine-rich PPR motif-containing protein, mitochondrial-like [Galendromus occidentalis]
MGNRPAIHRMRIAIPNSSAPLSQASLRFQSQYGDNDRKTFEDMRWASNEPKAGMQKALRELNEQVQRRGRIYERTLEDALTHAEKQGSLRGVEMQLLLRATGSFLREMPPAQRVHLAERIWNLTPKDQLDISHYNTLLYVKLENGEDFDPSDFLKELAEAGVAANRITYQRLVQRYCEMGDVPNATKIIDFMKSRNLPLNEKVFHSLIVGYVKSGSVDSARNILSIMTSAGVKPSAETHTVLAKALIESGDSASGLEAVSSQKLSDEQILRLVKSLALRNDFDSCDKLLKRISDPRFNFTSYNNVCVELIVAGNLDAAIYVYRKKTIADGKFNAANFLTVTAAKNGYSCSEVTRVFEELREQTETSAFIEAARFGIYGEDTARAEDFLAKLKELGFPMRSHYFYPALCRAEDEAAVYETLSRMVSAGVSLDFDTLVDFVAPRLDFSDVNGVLEKLEKAGVPAKLATTCVAFNLLKGNRFEEAEELLQARPSIQDGVRLTAVLASRVTEENIPISIKILEKLVNICADERPQPDLVGTFISNASDEAAIEALSHTQLPISSRRFRSLIARGVNVECLRGNVVDMPDYDYHILSDTHDEDLEALALRADRGDRVSASILRRLLTVYCRERNLEKVDEVLPKLERYGLTGANYSHLVALHCHLMDPERALHYLSEANSKEIEVNPRRVLQIASVLVEQSRVAEAEALLDEYSRSLSVVSDEHLMWKEIGQLMKALTKKQGAEETLNFFDKYFSRSAVTEVFGYVIRGFAEEDLSKAFELIKETAYRYRSAPCRKLVCMRLIQENKTEELEALMSVITSIFGQTDCSVDMVLCYLECDKIDEAKATLLRCRGERAKASLMRACNTYLNDNKKDCLDRLFGLMDELNVERDVAALYRIKQLNRTNDVKAAMDIWTESQEENIVLLPMALQILANMLERNGQEVPFVVPSNEGGLGGLSPENTVFQRILSGSLDKAFSMRNELKAQEKTLSFRDSMALITALTDAGRLAEAFEVARDLKTLSTQQFRQLIVSL